MAMSENLDDALDISRQIEALETLKQHVRDAIMQTELGDWKEETRKHPLTIEANAEIAQLRSALVELR